MKKSREKSARPFEKKYPIESSNELKKQLPDSNTDEIVDFGWKIRLWNNLNALEEPDSTTSNEHILIYLLHFFPFYTSFSSLPANYPRRPEAGQSADVGLGQREGS